MQNAMIRTKILGIIGLSALMLAAGAGLYAAVAQLSNLNGSPIPAPIQVPAAKNGTLTVSGTGTIIVQPDRAKISVGAIVQSSTSTAAASDDAKVMAAIIKVLNQVGIANDSIQTASYNVNPVYSYTNGAPPTITGFSVAHILLVTVVQSDLTQLGKMVGQVIDQSVAAGANQVNGVEFTISDDALKQTKAVALQAAVQDASTKASSIASAAGVKVTAVLSMKEASVSYPGFAYYAVASAANVSTTPILPPNSLTVSASIQATYTLG